MKLTRVYISSLEVRNKLQEIKFSPEWYKARGFPYGSSDTVISTGAPVVALTLQFELTDAFSKFYSDIQKDGTISLLEVTLEEMIEEVAYDD